MVYLLTFLWCLPSPIIWVFNAEAWIVGQALSGVDFPIAMAVLAAAAQCIAFTFLFYGGELVLRRLPRVRARLERFDLDRYRRAGYLFLSLAAVVGLPPLVLMSLVGRTLHYRYAWFISICLVGRVGRFAVLALAPDTFRSLFGATTG